MTNYIAEYDAITQTMQRYIEGGRAGKSEIIAPVSILRPPSLVTAVALC
jgi:hypothetical protein